MNRPAKTIKGQYIMLSPTSLKSNDTKKYIKDANIDPNSVGRILENDNGLYNIRWIDAHKMIRDGLIDPDLLFKNHDDFIFLNAPAVKEDIKNRLWFEDPLELPDLNHQIQFPDLADVMSELKINGGKKSRKNRKLYKKSCKSRKAHKKSYKSRKAHNKSYKSRKAHKSRRRARRWIYMRCDGIERKCFN